MKSRIEFAHMLRGIAALSVLLGHFCGTFFIFHDGIAGLLQVPPLANLPLVTGPAKFISDFSIVLGQFGVGVFFVISGFVIPFSLASSGRWEFLRKRAFRILPVYIIGFTLVMVSVLLVSWYAGSAFGYSIDHLTSHFGILTRGWLGYSRIDGISWTLEVELYFYLAAAVIGISVLKRGPWALAIAATILAGLSIASTRLMAAGHYGLVGNSGFQIWASLLLVLGLSFHAHYRKDITSRQVAIIHAWVAFLFVFTWLFSNREVYHWQWPTGYVLGGGVFALCYWLRDAIRPGPVLSHLADISYPLYVVHALLGYAVMYWAIDNGTGAYGAILLAAGSAYTIALVLHITVEKRFMSKSKAAKLPPKTELASAP